MHFRKYANLGDKNRIHPQTLSENFQINLLKPMIYGLLCI